MYTCRLPARSPEATPTRNTKIQPELASHSFERNPWRFIVLYLSRVLCLWLSLVLSLTQSIVRKSS